MFNQLNAIFLLFSAIGPMFFFYRRGLRYLQFLQQEDYESARFANWYLHRKAFDRRGTLVALGAIIITIFAQTLAPSLAPLLIGWLGLAACVGIISLALQEEDPRVAGKLALKMTDRAKRIFYLALAIYLVTIFFFLVTTINYQFETTAVFFWIVQIFLFQAEPFLLILANAVLDPYEQTLQEDFANQARVILQAIHPTVIGITGSYGKTSTKVILTEILNSVSPTFTTPRSINSYMGVTREIRERLKEQHRFAVIEMGAYYTGSIKRMCSLTPPQAAIVTAIGEMHLERFGSQENVFKAKSELPQALPEDGVLVVNGDYQYCRQIATNSQCKHVYLYGLDEDKGKLDAFLTDIHQTAQGTFFSIAWQGVKYNGFTKLLGRPMLSNALASFTMACALGINPEVALAVLRNVKTEANRLEPVRASISSLQLARNGREPRSGNILRLNDAYNSNPQGFAGALEVLGSVAGKRKVLVTPGMIELGEKQWQENKNAACKAAAFCDLILIVGHTNEKALLEGLTEANFESSKYRQFDTMRQALSYLAEDYCSDGDVVLIENDLPDLYESAPVF